MIDAKRGKRLNVIGAFLSSGRFYAAKLWQTTTALVFVGFLGLLLEQVKKPLIVILDNASVHSTKLSEPLLNVLKQQGLRLYFLPPYSPELNRIEKLWHKMKYEWLAFKARNPQELEKDVGDIIDGFGGKYQFSFN